MKISIVGPTNIKKFCAITGRSMKEIEPKANEIGKIIAEGNHQLVAIFNYSGMIKLVGDSYKKHGGKLEMFYTENDSDWDTEIYMKYLEEADIKTKKDSWHNMLLSLVKDSDIVLCLGLAAGTLAELGYMKWNYQEHKGSVKALIGIKEFLRNGEFPPEISFDMSRLITISSVDELKNTLKKFI